MKRTKFSGILMLVVLSLSMLVSCSKNNEDEGGNTLPLTKENLIGGWVYESKSIKIVFTFKSDGKGEYTYFVNSNPSDLLSFTFNYDIKGDKLVLSNMVHYDKKAMTGEREYLVNLYKDKMLLKDEFGTDTYIRDDFWASH